MGEFYHRRKCAGWKRRVKAMALQTTVCLVYLQRMNDTPTIGILDDLLEPLSRCLDAESARRVAEFRIAPVIQEKINALAERANEGLLTDEERAEYEAIINAADIISILKLKAEHNLKMNGG
jgi:hypothetical protein